MEITIKRYDDLHLAAYTPAGVTIGVYATDSEETAREWAKGDLPKLGYCYSEPVSLPGERWMDDEKSC